MDDVSGQPIGAGLVDAACGKGALCSTKIVSGQKRPDLRVAAARGGAQPTGRGKQRVAGPRSGNGWMAAGPLPAGGPNRASR